MNKNGPNNQEDQEIDLTQISKKISSLFQRFNTFLFTCIQFFVKNIIAVSILLFVGVGLGILLDQTQKTFDNHIIVEPNFKSTDYLYSKINLLAAKIAEKDTVFFKSIGIQNSKEINKITIEPIVDVYKFINNNGLNLELLQLMAQNGDLKSVVKETTTSKNYTFHTIIVSTKAVTDPKNTIQPILNYLNTSLYFEEVQKISISNIQQKIKAKEGIIDQIDGILNEYSSVNDNRQKNDKLIYYNENLQLNDIIKTKDSLTKDIGTLKIQLFNSNKIIKDSTVVMNIKNTKSINDKLKFVLPVVLILGFIFISFFISFYRKQSLKVQQNGTI
ncbi:hypothetical protein ACM55G_01925 [Flavobacterium sp. LB3P122]|uniref:hypothetical protein n=1 Tax=Flavobacterium algoriphilum TaxID=3398738 RepID=UPI003A899314